MKIKKKNPFSFKNELNWEIIELLYGIFSLYVLSFRFSMEAAGDVKTYRKYIVSILYKNVEF